MTIGRLAQQSGISASAIRYYEKLEILPAPARISGRRQYGPRALERVAVLRLAQASGFTLDEIRRLFHGFDKSVPAAERWQQLARVKMEEVTLEMRRLETRKTMLAALLHCRCTDLVQCVGLS